MIHRASVAALFAFAVAPILGACSSAPEHAAPAPNASSATEPEKATCDLVHSAVTFDAPRVDGTHAHGFCDACLQDKCCELTVSCFGHDGAGLCAPFGACLDACQAKLATNEDPKAVFLCRDACRAADAAAAPLYDAYLACRTASCHAVCADAD